MLPPSRLGPPETVLGAHEVFTIHSESDG
jgi:hypothetical protein